MSATHRRTTRAVIIYAASLVAAVALFLFIRAGGERIAAPTVNAHAVPIDTAANQAAAHLSVPAILWHLLLALAAVVIVGRLLGLLFHRLGQPPVMGEIIGGILLGPSLLGLIAPSAQQYLLPPPIAPYLGAIAQAGVTLYMFLVGLELNPQRLKSQAQATVAISHASIVAPFLLGSALALFLYPRFSSADVPFTAFALFLGLSMSVTAFPVLARILSDRGMTQTDLGAVALTCAAVDDVTAWCLLAFVAGVAQSSAENAFMVAAFTLGFIAFMFTIVRPAAARFAVKNSNASGITVALALAGMSLAAWATAAIGIHAIFGAFLFGAILPHDGAPARTLKQKLGRPVTVLLLPAFFAFTGMRTQIGLLSGWFEWLTCALIIVVATTGKFGGSFLAGLLTGLPWRYGAALGVLMNTRGLMELIVLNVGLDLGILSPALFAMMVLMALVTTLMTTPILARLKVA
jgi:Kef-type K+ transport system membrane component KefB